MAGTRELSGSLVREATRAILAGMNPLEAVESALFEQHVMFHPQPGMDPYGPPHHPEMMQSHMHPGVPPPPPPEKSNAGLIIGGLAGLGAAAGGGYLIHKHWKKPTTPVKVTPPVKADPEALKKIEQEKAAAEQEKVAKREDKVARAAERTDAQATRARVQGPMDAQADKEAARKEGVSQAKKETAAAPIATAKRAKVPIHRKVGLVDPASIKRAIAQRAPESSRFVTHVGAMARGAKKTTGEAPDKAAPESKAKASQYYDKRRLIPTEPAAAASATAAAAEAPAGTATPPKKPKGKASNVVQLKPKVGGQQKGKGPSNRQQKGKHGGQKPKKGKAVKPTTGTEQPAVTPTPVAVQKGMAGATGVGQAVTPAAPPKLTAPLSGQAALDYIKAHQAATPEATPSAKAQADDAKADAADAAAAVMTKKLTSISGKTAAGRSERRHHIESELKKRGILRKDASTLEFGGSNAPMNAPIEQTLLAASYAPTHRRRLHAQLKGRVKTAWDRHIEAAGAAEQFEGMAKRARKPENKEKHAKAAGQHAQRAARFLKKHLTLKQTALGFESALHPEVRKIFGEWLDRLLSGQVSLQEGLGGYLRAIAAYR